MQIKWLPLIAMLFIAPMASAADHQSSCVSHYKEHHQALSKPEVDTGCLNASLNASLMVSTIPTLICASFYAFKEGDEHMCTERPGYIRHCYHVRAKIPTMVTGSLSASLTLIKFAADYFSYQRDFRWTDAELAASLVEYAAKGSFGDADERLKPLLAALNKELASTHKAPPFNGTELSWVLKNAVNDTVDGFCRFNNDGTIKSKPYTYKEMKARIISDWVQEKGWAKSLDLELGEESRSQLGPSRPDTLRRGISFSASVTSEKSGALVHLEGKEAALGLESIKILEKTNIEEKKEDSKG